MELESRNLVDGRSSDDAARVALYLARFGYFLGQGLDPGRDRIFGLAHREAIARFQRVGGLRDTGDLNDDTLRLMNTPRCGVPDPPELMIQGRQPRYTPIGRWPRDNISFSGSLSGHFIPDSQVLAIARAIREPWSDVSRVNWVGPGDLPQYANVTASFQSGSHGSYAPFGPPCPSAFEGPGTTWAHAFYPPPQGGGLAGQMHFDVSEQWTIDTPVSGLDFVSVGLHEVGHALGLGHSSVVGAVMWPYINMGEMKRALHADDISGIQALYGAR